jgi:hypothetical protein
LTVYVDQTNGTSPADGSAGAPFCTIQAGVDIVQPAGLR